MRIASNKLTQEEFLGFKSGNCNTFKKVFEIYHRVIYKYVISYCKINEEAEEIIQEIFTNLYLNRDKIEELNGIYPYLFTLAKRMTITNFKHSLVKSKYNLYLKYTWKESYDQIEESMSAAELSIILENIINELPPKQQEIYRLKSNKNLSYKQIAEKIGISQNTVKNHLVAAYKTVKLKISKSDLYILIIYFYYN